MPTPQHLKDEAEAGVPNTGITPATPDALLHELQVHQVELEMQNETLRDSLAALESSRDRYALLYEFAPVGYLTLNDAGVIVEGNFMAATLLGAKRQELLWTRFEHRVAVGDRERWRRLFSDHWQNAGHSCDLNLLRDNGDEFPAALDFQALEFEERAGETRLTFTDISERKRMELALEASHESFRRLAQISPAAIFRADMSGACSYANRRCEEIAGRPLRDLLGRGWLEAVHPEDRDLTLATWRSDISRGQPKPLEWRVLRPDGTIRWVLSEAAAELDGQGRRIGYISCISDITDLRQREQKRHAELAEHRDTLVREVHHRIKNNLQSVAGLLRRELGQFVELDPRLEVAISQINAIAVVHGLQGAHPDEAIRLCDSVRNICKTVAELSQRPVVFAIEQELTTFKPVQIDSSEAIPVALVLNELILNAVKHSPSTGRDPTVSLGADGASARLVICNDAAAAPEFDIDTGQGLGTGLRLVRSLLPNRGASLTYRWDEEGLMHTSLDLTAPVILRIPPPEAILS